MPANECLPYKQPAGRTTAKATAVVTGKRFVKISGNRTGGPDLSTNVENVKRVAHAVAGDTAYGVAGHDIAQNGLGTILCGPGWELPITAGENLDAGDLIVPGAGGKAFKAAASQGVAASGNAETLTIPRDVVVHGIVLNGALADADAEIRLLV
jgi:hypothetical protein